MQYGYLTTDVEVVVTITIGKTEFHVNMHLKTKTKNKNFTASYFSGSCLGDHNKYISDILFS